MKRGTRKPAEFDNFPIRFVDSRAMGKNRAVCKRVIDGDTYDLYVDLGCYTFTFETFRLHNFDTPEVVGTDRPRGLAAMARVVELLQDKPCLIQTYVTPTDREEETFGRLTAAVWYWDGAGWPLLAETLGLEGHAK